MVFASHIFVFYFLPLVLLVYYNLPFRWRNAFLMVLSYVFYGWWQPWFILLMLGCTVLNYIAGELIAARGATARRRKGVLAAACAINLVALGFFKYYMFSADSLNHLLGLVGAGTFRVLRVTLPIGISFYTFQAISYVVDIYRGDAPPARSFFDFACFKALFPQLIAGPIIRYHTVADQLVWRDHTSERFAAGVALFILGIAKKTLLANPMGDVADAIFNAAAPGAILAWLGAAAYAFQIYFDFAGYSDMAVGLARMVGFEFMKNFDAPYRADSITDLWRRWHISLSTFLRDYLYIPLGGNRKGLTRTYGNLLVVMLLGGLWHGAKWTFVAWGAYHGILLAYERWRGKTSVYHALPRPVRIAITFVLMLFSWVLFRSDSMSAAIRYFGAMFALRGADGGGMLLAADALSPMHVLVGAVCVFLVFQPVQAHDWVSARAQSWARAAILVPLFILALAAMFTQTFQPFLYFQF